MLGICSILTPWNNRNVTFTFKYNQKNVNSHSRVIGLANASPCAPGATVMAVSVLTSLTLAGTQWTETRLIFTKLVHDIAVGQWLFVTWSLHDTQFFEYSSADSQGRWHRRHLWTVLLWLWSAWSQTASIQHSTADHVTANRPRGGDMTQQVDDTRNVNASSQLTFSSNSLKVR